MGIVQLDNANPDGVPRLLLTQLRQDKKIVLFFQSGSGQGCLFGKSDGDDLSLHPNKATSLEKRCHVWERGIDFLLYRFPMQ